MRDHQIQLPVGVLCELAQLFTLGAHKSEDSLMSIEMQMNVIDRQEKEMCDGDMQRGERTTTGEEKIVEYTATIGRQYFSVYECAW